MLVSWNWLKEYVALDMPQDELQTRLAMAGLNHEGTEPIGDDLAVDLEVTSNRPDCLGHLGVAREISVLWQTPLRLPEPAPGESGPAANSLVKVRIDCPELCQRYSARVIRGVRIGPSPAWLVERLRTIGIASVNNVVDITNYVLMECGQPLHAFDLAKLAGPEIIVREAAKGEMFEAINHKSYALQPGMCVISDAQRAVALGGVMGGAESEVTDTTTDLLIESADFSPLSIRTTARQLNLHSPSSFRFERGVDPEGVDWASRRCCELILELAGGSLAAGAVAAGTANIDRTPVVLRLSQIPRVLGIEVDAAEVRRILSDLGCEEVEADKDQIQTVPPTWRRDLSREIDLVEEVARIHGYDRIPEDVGVPMSPSHRSDHDRVQDKVRRTLTSAGFDEAMTASVVPEEWSDAFSPWSDQPAIQASTPMLKGADRLRRSLIPSLLEAKRINEALANPVIELFEIAHIYLPQGATLPREQWTLGLVSGRDFFLLKGVIEAMLTSVSADARLEATDWKLPLLDAEKSCELRIGERRFGLLGEVDEAGVKQFGLRSATIVAELDLQVLADAAQLIPQHVELSAFPSIERDLNLIVDEAVRWSDLETVVRNSAGEVLEDVRYQETYRDPQKDGNNKKRLLLSITLRSHERTLTNEEADEIRETVVAACSQSFAAVLLGG